VTTKQRLIHWVPTAFCAFLSLMVLFRPSVAGSSSWQPTFFAFLPMCFVFVAIVTSSLYRQNLELQRQLAELRAKR
jgi:hypothetical protein